MTNLSTGQGSSAGAPRSAVRISRELIRKETLDPADLDLFVAMPNLKEKLTRYRAASVATAQLQNTGSGSLFVIICGSLSGSDEGYRRPHFDQSFSSMLIAAFDLDFPVWLHIGGHLKDRIRHSVPRGCGGFAGSFCHFLGQFRAAFSVRPLRVFDSTIVILASSASEFPASNLPSEVQTWPKYASRSSLP